MECKAPGLGGNARKPLSEPKVSLSGARYGSRCWQRAFGLVLLGSCPSDPGHSMDKGLDVRKVWELCARIQRRGRVDGMLEELKRRFIGNSKEPSRTSAKGFAL